MSLIKPGTSEVLPGHDVNQPCGEPSIPPSSSSSSYTAATAAPIPSIRNDSRKSYLDVPSFRLTSRPSLDSTFTELSELSFHSEELRATRPLIRTVPGDDGKAPTSAWSRFVVALHNFHVVNYGAMLVVLAQFFGVGMNVSTQLLETAGSHGEPMHPYQILFVRQSITASLCTAYGLYTKSIPDFPLGPRDVRWLLVSRGLCGFFGVFGMYFSLLYLPLSEATVLTFLSPILSCYLCSFVIPGETFTKQQQLAGFLSLVGVVFIAQPASLFASSSPSSSEGPVVPARNSTMAAQEHPPAKHGPTPHEHLLAIAIAMVGVLGSTGAFTSIRAIGTRAHAFISINYFSVWCTIVSMFCLIVFPEVKFRLPANSIEWTLLASLGLFGFIMQFLLTAGLTYGGPSAPGKTSATPDHPSSFHKPGDVESHDRDRPESFRFRSIPRPTAAGSGTRATSMVYVQMLFALASDKIFFKITPTAMSWVGSGLILAGAIWVAAARDGETTSSHKASTDNAMLPGPPMPAGRGSGRGGKQTDATEESVGLTQDYDTHDDTYDDGHGETTSAMHKDKDRRTVEVLELDELPPTHNH
ncbi:hypothetical protein PV08_03849 [Exophiala spinifera]|uniref:EamA domain-containing protein n=1 Tax=Exophiala spinifera TaxID=91928 RepID=A0A0D1YNJ2_9EURO|nr:uncharacterized protein PV08_03849 [Exophiala spinifera]KIW16661.1 hypothetical protein PV08_03849 [Exophiala spinifera]